MDDKFIMMDVLANEKNMTVNTAIAMNEASCNEVYNVYSDLFNDLTKEVKEIFTICYNNNWYQLEASESTKIKQENTKLCGELNNKD